MNIVNQYHFDGVDLDWEYPIPGPSAQNFLILMQELRMAMQKDSLLTAALVALGEYAPGIPNESFTLMDFANIMAYDDASSPQHSSMDYARSALDYWLGRGFTSGKSNPGDAILCPPD